jgi:hypothetical protein
LTTVCRNYFRCAEKFVKGVRQGRSLYECALPMAPIHDPLLDKQRHRLSERHPADGKSLGEFRL